MKKYMYGIGLVVLLAITLFILPIWQVRAMDIDETQYYSEEDILKSMTFKNGMHILRLKKSQIKEELEKLPYIKEASIHYSFPNNIRIQLTESRAMGYVKFLDTYLCIDEDGYVVEETNQKRLPLPEIEGLKFNQFVIGQKLEVEDSEQLPLVKEMILTLNKYDFTQNVDSIQVTNIQQIHLYVNKLNVIIGNIREFDKKVKYLIEVHKQYAMGILDLSLIDHKQAILKPMN